MLALRKAWIWIKKHWYVPVLFVLILVTGVFSFSRNKKLIKMLEINKESYEKQIEAIESAHAAEIQKRDELYDTYVSTMEKLKKEHNVSLEDLSEEKKKKMETMVKKYEGSPEELAKELSEMFGVDYVE
tara:strand:+ start:3860 stop:4246 length:387 start_codon:yes stop_codon:yes gene_type:complete